MTGGWQAQWDRVSRWYRRLSSARNADDRHDFLYAFFENAFHLRDWLSDSGAAIKKELNGFFDSSPEMRLCRDLANSHKHFSIRDPSQPDPPSEAYEYSPGAGNLNDDVSLVILSGGEKYDAFDLARRVLDQWKAFLSNHVMQAPSDEFAPRP